MPLKKWKRKENMGDVRICVWVCTSHRIFSFSGEENWFTLAFTLCARATTAFERAMIGMCEAKQSVVSCHYICLLGRITISINRIRVNRNRSKSITVAVAEASTMVSNGFVAASNIINLYYHQRLVLMVALMRVCVCRADLGSQRNITLSPVNNLIVNASILLANYERIINLTESIPFERDERWISPWMTHGTEWIVCALASGRYAFTRSRQSNRF